MEGRTMAVNCPKCNAALDVDEDELDEGRPEHICLGGGFVFHENHNVEVFKG